MVNAARPTVATMCNQQSSVKLGVCFASPVNKNMTVSDKLYERNSVARN